MKRFVLFWVVILALFFFFRPALGGFHIGCSGDAGDNVSETNWGLLWCKHEAPVSEGASAPTTTVATRTTSSSIAPPVAKELKEEEAAKEAAEAKEFDAKEKREARERAAREPGEVRASEGR